MRAVRRKRLILLAAFTAVIGGVALKARSLRADLATPRDLHGVAFVGSAACAGCHGDRHRSWHRTFHRTMTAEATNDSVLGRFDGATLRHDGVTARMDRDGMRAFRMTFARAGEAPRSVAVARAVGSHRYQQYLTKVGDAFWRLPVAWHVEEKRWFPMTGAFLFSDEADNPGGPERPVFGGGIFDRHVTRWNDNCVFCHNVAPNPGVDAATGAFRTTTAELGIACEACHGPGGEHVRVADDSSRRLFIRVRGAADPTIVNPRRLPPARAAEVCGRCHGQRLAADVGPFLAHGDPFVPGDDLARYTKPLQRDTALHGDHTAFAARFWSDGTPRLTAYEFQGLLQSRCAQRGGLTCITCHGMHDGDPRGQLRTAFRGAGADRMCTGCHTALADAAALARHSHHDPAGEGARCVGCHMPRIVYGVLGVHRSHRIEVPDRLRAAAAGRPDACAGCHVDAAPSSAFAGDPITRAHPADALGHADVPLSTAARAARRGTLLEVMRGDGYPAVRHLAWRSFGSLSSGRLSNADIRAYDPSGDAAERAAAVARFEAALGADATLPGAADVAAWRVASHLENIDIGE